MFETELYSKLNLIILNNLNLGFSLSGFISFNICTKKSYFYTDLHYTFQDEFLKIQFMCACMCFKGRRDTGNLLYNVQEGRNTYFSYNSSFVFFLILRNTKVDYTLLFKEYFLT